MTIANAALTATTANTIQGKKPSLSSTHITAISNEDDFKLFGLDVDGNKYFTDADISTKLNTVLNSASLSLCS